MNANTPIHGFGRTAALISILGIAAICTGCGRDGGKDIVPVSGQVLYEGKPLPQAQVTFVPLTEDGDLTVRPTATADANGRFKLSTHKPGDGVPQGEYRVVVEHRRRLVYNGEEKIGDNWLPRRYSDSKVSELRVHVADGPKDVSLALKR